MKFSINHEIFEDSPAATRRSRNSNITRFAAGLLPALFALVVLVYTFVIPVQVGLNHSQPAELWKLALYQLPTMVVMGLLLIVWPNLCRRNCRILALKETFFPEEEPQQEEGEKLSRREARAVAKANREQYRREKKALKKHYGSRILGSGLRYGLSVICLILTADGIGLFSHGIRINAVKFLHILALVVAILAVIGWIMGMIALRSLGKQNDPPENEAPEQTEV